MSVDDARTALSAALAAERAGRWDESRRLCQLALTDARFYPDGFNLMGRLFGHDGDAAMAIAMQRFVLTLEPAHPQAALDLSAALGAVRSAADAETHFRSAVALAPDVACHHRYPASLLPFAGMATVEQLLQRAVESDPSFAPAHAALGNILARQQQQRAAVRAYRLAAMLRWEWPDVHLALSHLFDALHDEASAERHRREALSRKHLYPSAAANAGVRVLVLAAPGNAMTNTPLDFCVNHESVALHVYYLVDGAGPEPELPEHDLVFNAIAPAERSAAAIERCARFVAAQGKPVINQPARLAHVHRTALRTTLRDVAGCTLPETLRLSREQLAGAAGSVTIAGFDAPIVIRPVDSHGGIGLERCAASDELADYLGRVAGEHFYASPFVDYRSADGYYRKYRVIVVDGEPFAYHLAISDRWMVHYHSSLMEEHAWMREEEERFLREPQAVFAGWDRVFRGIADAVGLDYFGIDCTVGPDEAVLVFECGGDMLVHCMDAPDLFGYKYDHVPRIFAALETMLATRSRADA